MKFWKDNRLDGEYVVGLKEVLLDFLKSKQSRFYDWPLERRLRAYLLGYGTYEEDGFQELYQVVKKHRGWK